MKLGQTPPPIKMTTRDTPLPLLIDELDNLYNQLIENRAPEPTVMSMYNICDAIKRATHMYHQTCHLSREFNFELQTQPSGVQLCEEDSEPTW